MKLLPRDLSTRLREYLKIFPIVAIIGPRQSGKTTFVKMELPSWAYFDLERPSDFTRISQDIEFFLTHYGDNCIIDEAQTLTELFAALRHHVDTSRNKKGRIVLLGSVNPLLARNISESLAGRIGFIEVEPFHYSEISHSLNMNIEEFWLRGGYPEPLLWDTRERTLWMEQYVKTFVERDIFRTIKTSIAPLRQSQLLIMLAHCHGKLWNASQVSSAFGVSYHTINTYVDLMESYFLVKKLSPYYINIGKRLVKSPKFYYRDSGLLHYLLNITDLEALRTSPYRGFSFEGFVISQLIHQLSLNTKDRVEFYFYRTAQGDEIDLLVQIANRLIAYEIKVSTTIHTSDLIGFQKAIDQLGITSANIVYLGREDYRLNPKIEVKSAHKLFGREINR